MHQIDKSLGNLAALRASLLWNLISDAPHHNRRVIFVAKNKVCQILLNPVVEIQMIAVLALRINPLVEALCHDHHSK